MAKAKKKWDKRSFLQAWIACESATTWDKFYRAMNSHSEEGGFGGIAEKTLALRCGAVGASVRKAGFVPPSKPDRPRSTPIEIPMGDVAKSLGLKKA